MHLAETLSAGRLPLLEALTLRNNRLGPEGVASLADALGGLAERYGVGVVSGGGRRRQWVCVFVCRCACVPSPCAG
jgi:hypothetical protein